MRDPLQEVEGGGREGDLSRPPWDDAGWGCVILIGQKSNSWGEDS